jgi:hypothetical protein
MHTRHLAAVLLLVGGPCFAQTAGSRRPALAAYDSFLRIAGFVDKPVAELSRAWPVFSVLAPESGMLSLSAAHRISVSFGAVRSPGAATSDRVERVTYIELLPDTLLLRQHTLELIQRITADYGAATLCQLPLGPPAYLYAPQRVARFWKRGVAGQPTQLRWEVATGPVYVITIDVGGSIDAERGSLACDSRMP